MTDNIVTLFENNLLDLAAQLRALADRLESGEDVARTMVVIGYDPATDGVCVYAWGERSDWLSINGLLAIAQGHIQ